MRSNIPSPSMSIALLCVMPILAGCIGKCAIANRQREMVYLPHET